MSFAEQLRALCEKAQVSTETFVKKTALQLEVSVIQLSAVDTGQFRANWAIGIGAKNATVTQAVDKSGQVSIEKAATALEAWEPGQSIWLTNSLPQAAVLEYGLYGKPPGSANGPKTVGGYSRQSPGGMVRLTVQNFQAYAKKALEASK